MTLSFPPAFNPFISKMVVQPEQLGLVANEDLQLATLKARMKELGVMPSEEEATVFVDSVEALIATELPAATFTWDHTFTPGLYGREISMPAGSLLTSKTHETEHQFVLLSGLVMVWTRETGAKVYRGPYNGITKPGTRRILYTFEDTRWKTFHANPDNLTDPDEIVSQITSRHHNPMLERALGRLTS